MLKSFLISQGVKKWLAGILPVELLSKNLKEIVDSDIYKVIKDRKKEESIQKYIHIDLDALYSLQSELSAYLLLLGINNEEDYDNDYLMGEE